MPRVHRWLVRPQNESGQRESNEKAELDHRPAKANRNITDK